MNVLLFNDFIYYVFGELFDIFYILEVSVKSNIMFVILDLKE